MIRSLWIALVMGASLAACSSNSSNSAGGTTQETTGFPCTKLEQCNWDRCVCTDGTATDFVGVCFQGTCTTGGAAACTKHCATHGGFGGIAGRPTLVGSPECNAICSKVASCPNASCNAFTTCGIGRGESDACVRSNLACMVNRETFVCTPGGSGSWMFSGDCASTCGGDAG